MVFFGLLETPVELERAIAAHNFQQVIEIERMVVGIRRKQLSQLII